MTLLGWWALAFVFIAGAGALLVGTIAKRRISGFTGDVLGATEQVIEIGLFILGAALGQAVFLSGPWWSS
jgi:cobalamin synthase